MFMILDVGSKKIDKTDYLAFYLTDMLQSFGPLCTRWHDYYISKALSADELERLQDGLAEHGIEGRTRPYSLKKKVLHVRGDAKSTLPRSLMSYFYRQTPSDIIRWTYSFPDQCLEISANIEETLKLQKHAHRILRDIHEEGFSLRYEPTRRKLNSFIREQANDRLSGIVKKCNQLLKAEDPDNQARLDEVNLRLDILLHTEPGAPPKGVSSRRNALLTRDSIEELFSSGKVGLTDTEFGEYKTDNPYVYLDTLVHMSGNKTTGAIFSLYSIGKETLETEDGAIPFIFDPDKDRLRQRIAKYRFDSDFLVIAGHNVSGFDEQKCVNPLRESKKGREKGDGVFLVNCDNTEPYRVSDRGGLELMSLRSAILLDTLRIARNHFQELLPDMKLETIMTWFNRLHPGFTYEFQKLYKSYTDLEDDRLDWENGDISKGIRISEYGYLDSKAPLLLVRELMLPIVEIARATSSTVFNASVLSPVELSERLWDRIDYSKTNHPISKAHRENSAYPKQESFRQKLSSTPMLSKYNIKETKLRMISDIIARSGVEVDNSPSDRCSAYYLPAITQGLGFLRLLNEARENFTDSDSPMTSIIQYNITEAIGAGMLVDIRRTAEGDLNPRVFYAKYGMDPDDAAARFEESLASMFGNLKSSTIRGFTGNYIFLEGDPDDSMLYLGEAKTLPIVDTKREFPPLIFSLEGLLSSSGIKIPSEKDRTDHDPFSKGKAFLEIMFVYDFIKAYFQDGRENSLKLLDDYSKRLASGDFHPYDFLRTIRRKKEFYENPGLKNVRLLQAFDVPVGGSLTYAVGSCGKEGHDFIQVGLDREGRNAFRESYQPLCSHYQNLVFGGFRLAPGEASVDTSVQFQRTTLYRIAESAFMQGKPTEPKTKAYHNLKVGCADESDLEALLE